MSDRHIAQKNINSVFQDYRGLVRPTVVANWDNISGKIKQKVNDFIVVLISRLVLLIKLKYN